MSAAKERLARAEEQAKQAVSKKLADLERKSKEDLEEQISRARDDMQASLSEALRESERQLEEEMARKIREAKKDFAAKRQEESKKIQEKHDTRLAGTEAALTEQVNQRLAEARRTALELEAPREEREAHLAVVAQLKGEEERFVAAATRLANLKGKKLAPEDLIPAPSPSKEAGDSYSEYSEYSDGGNDA